MATGRVPTTANSPLTTKGDLFGYSTAPARLAVGSDGETIVADSSTSTGLKWEGGWTTFTPTYINLTPGNGTVIARYRKVGKTVEVFFRLTWGSTTSCGNYPIVGYPASLTPAYTNFIVGNTGLFEAGVGIWCGLTYADTNNGLLIMAQYTGGNWLIDGVVQATNPTTWTTGDIWTMTAKYEVA